MVQGVLVNDNGECDEVKLTLNRNGVFLKKQKLYLNYHNADENLVIFCTKQPETLLDTEEQVFTFSLPPPLNHFVYPSELYICKGTVSKIEDLTASDLVSYCAKFQKSMTNIQTSLSVYDVPLDESVFEQEESDDDGDDESCEASDEEQEENDDDEDWEAEDDDGPA